MDVLQPVVEGMVHIEKKRKAKVEELSGNCTFSGFRCTAKNDDK